MSKNKKAASGEPIYDARTLGIPKMMLLGLQHMFAMFGATVLVPIIVNSYGLPLSIQTTLLFAGLGTLLFHVCTKLKVPAFLGSSFAFLGGFGAVAALDTGIYADMTGAEKLPYALGGIVVAGLLYVVLALVIKVLGVRKVMRFLPPVVTGPIIILIGLILAPTAITNAATNWWLAALAVAVIICCNIFGRGMIKIIPILLGVAIPYITALCLGLVEFGGVQSVNLVGLQDFAIARFDLTAILVMAPIAIAAIMEHVGDISAISATCGKNFVEDPGLHRTLLGDGLATSIAALFGAPANTTYGENTGVLVLSRVYDPKVIRLAAVYAVVLSFSPKFAQVILSIPSAIIGGVSFILYGMISAVGVRNIVENRVDFTKSRNLIIAAIILVSGLGFNNYGGLTFTIGGAHVTLTGLAIAAILGIALNAILPGNDYQFGVDPSADGAGNLGQY
ncbi:MAG: ABC transporter permease [Clostridium sp. SCN 57-10]|nr:MAG: ABC transporter permease [Clostridium sp. SCN 57-10]